MPTEIFDFFPLTVRFSGHIVNCFSSSEESLKCSLCMACRGAESIPPKEEIKGVTSCAQAHLDFDPTNSEGVTEENMLK